MKRKNTKAPTKAQRSLKQTGPVWMDDGLKLAFEKMSPEERQLRAELMEHQAAQLREMKPAPVKFVCRVGVPLRPKMKEAILAFAQRHGARPEWDEQLKLETGARWFFESALSMVAKISEVADCRSKYWKAEGIEYSDFTERIIGAALKKY